MQQSPLNKSIKSSNFKTFFSKDSSYSPNKITPGSNMIQKNKIASRSKNTTPIAFRANSHSSSIRDKNMMDTFALALDRKSSRSKVKPMLLGKNEPPPKPVDYKTPINSKRIKEHSKIVYNLLKKSFGITNETKAAPSPNKFEYQYYSYPYQNNQSEFRTERNSEIHKSMTPEKKIPYQGLTGRSNFKTFRVSPGSVTNLLREASTSNLSITDRTAPNRFFVSTPSKSPKKNNDISSRYDRMMIKNNTPNKSEMGITNSDSMWIEKLVEEDMTEDPLDQEGFKNNLKSNLSSNNRPQTAYQSQTMRRMKEIMKAKVLVNERRASQNQAQKIKEKNFMKEKIAYLKNSTVKRPSLEFEDPQNPCDFLLKTDSENNLGIFSNKMNPVLTGNPNFHQLKPRTPIQKSPMSIFKSKEKAIKELKDAKKKKSEQNTERNSPIKNLMSDNMLMLTYMRPVTPEQNSNSQIKQKSFERIPSRYSIRPSTPENSSKKNNVDISKYLTSSNQSPIKVTFIPSKKLDESQIPFKRYEEQEALDLLNYSTTNVGSHRDREEIPTLHTNLPTKEFEGMPLKIANLNYKSDEKVQDTNRDISEISYKNVELNRSWEDKDLDAQFLKL